MAARLEVGGDDALRFTAVRLLCHTAVGPDRADLEWAVRRAYAMGEHLVATDLALRAVERDLATPLAFAAAVDAATSLAALGRLDAAATAFAAAEQVADGSPELALLISRWGGYLTYRRFDVAAALTLADRLDPRLDAADRRLVAPDVRTWRILAGEGAAEHIGPAWVGAEGASAAVVIRAAIAAVMLDSMGGRISDEVVQVLTAVEREHGVLDPFAADVVHLQRYFSLLSRGLGEEAAAVCEERRADCTPDAVGMWSLTLGIHRQYGGRLDEARMLAGLAVEQLRWRDPLGLLGFAVALEALVASQLGETARADELLGDLVPAQLADPKAAVLAAEARAHLLFAAGDADGAADQVVDVATSALAAGHSLVAAIGLGLCLRFDRAARAAPILRRIHQDVGPGMGLYAALDDAASGLVERDAAKVFGAAGRLADAGMTAAAIDVLDLAARLPAARPGGEVRRKLERATVRLVAVSQASRYQARLSSDDLSPREWEVVERVCARLSSREIAADLGVSARTVDNHLAKVYRSLGVSSRSELRELVNLG